jgi:hypothetical protein
MSHSLKKEIIFLTNYFIHFDISNKKRDKNNFLNLSRMFMDTFLNDKNNVT